jgi:phosphonopyruvate decarboxylase
LARNEKCDSWPYKKYKKYDSWLPERPITEEQRDFASPKHIYDEMTRLGTSFYTGVPDSLLANFCNYITDVAPDGKHVISANEGTALATAAGHHMATGEVPMVYLQNSGLGNIVNPLMSLVEPGVYSIPMLIMIGWRGQPGKKDEPQHLVQGQRTKAMLQV